MEEELYSPGGNSIAKWQNTEKGLRMELLSEYLNTFHIPQLIGRGI